MPLVLSPDLTLPDSYTTKTAGILAQRRKGKSYTAMVIAEEMCDAGIPWAAIDPTGAWWGLRAGANGGAGGGRPVVILGGQHGDLPLERGAGAIVADLVVDQPGWYILDLSAFESKAAEREFVTAFAQRLYRRKGQPGMDFAMHLFVDEADIFVSQSADKGDKLMLSAFEAIVRRGGIRGIGTTLISQRSAVVHKNVLEQLDILIALRTVGPNDQAAVKRLGLCALTNRRTGRLFFGRSHSGHPSRSTRGGSLWSSCPTSSTRTSVSASTRWKAKRCSHACSATRTTTPSPRETTTPRLRPPCVTDLSPLGRTEGLSSTGQSGRPAWPR